MKSNTGQQMYRIGQAIWYDNIQRGLLNNGELKKMIDEGLIYGITSNPSIFNQAISKTNDYDAEINNLTWAGLDAASMFWKLAISDIQRAADLFLPIYTETKGQDGYVSLEVDPRLAKNTLGTMKAAMKLWKEVDRPNLMIKVPATRQGLLAIRRLVSYGININVTLIFSLLRYAEVIDAYVSGLTDRTSKKKDISRIHSVASFFVSRVDTKVDALLENMVAGKKISQEQAQNLLGKTAIANAKKAYDIYQKSLTTKRFLNLQQYGANRQRPLWASTGTKNPGYEDVMYIENLIGRETVNTIPPQTLKAFSDHGKVDLTLSDGMDGVKATLDGLRKIGISMLDVTDMLEKEGVKAFEQAFTELLGSIEKRRLEVIDHHSDFHKKVTNRLSEMRKRKIGSRIFMFDGSIWSSDKRIIKEIETRLGWVNLPETSLANVNDMEKFSEKCWKNGFQQALVLGMGGSSLAPEVFSEIFHGKKNNVGMAVRILDSTDPEEVDLAEKFASKKQTLFIVSSKSGGTAEVSAMLEYFWQLQNKKVGTHAKDQFIAITDPGTPLEDLALKRKFLKCFLGEPNIGGRFSALSVFGLIPAALSGIDLERLLKAACTMKSNIEMESNASFNIGESFGAFIGENALCGRDKLTIISDPELVSLGSWVEQLVAESSGKDGKGILPVNQEPEYEPASYSTDRMFVYHRINGSQDDRVKRIRKSGFPVYTIEINDDYEIAGVMYLWEYATAIACRILGVNPFNQPDVQASKSITLGKLLEYKNTGKLIEPVFDHLFGDQQFLQANVSLFNENESFDFIRTLQQNSIKNGFIGINAFLPRNEKTQEMLTELREIITLRTKLPTTLGFGPRFLHSTGQFHKGGSNTGLFIELTQDSIVKPAFPPEQIPFAVLERAQALGDFDALKSRNRRVLRIHSSQHSLKDFIAGLK